MKQRGFTLIELVVSLGVLGTLILIVPPSVSHFMETYQEYVFLREFENDVKLAQLSALATQKNAKVTILGRPVNRMELSCYGDQRLNKNVSLPKHMSYSGVVDIQFKAGSGNISGLNKFGTIAFAGKKYRYTYTFHLAGGRYYVTTTKL